MQHGQGCTQWPGATISVAGNGNDDGRVHVATKVMGPTNGFWRYEYAIQNRYMSLESLAVMSENPPIRLPAAPALA